MVLPRNPLIQVAVLAVVLYLVHFFLFRGNVPDSPAETPKLPRSVREIKDGDLEEKIKNLPETNQLSPEHQNPANRLNENQVNEFS